MTHLDLPYGRFTTWPQVLPMIALILTFSAIPIIPIAAIHYWRVERRRPPTEVSTLVQQAHARIAAKDAGRDWKSLPLGSSCHGSPVAAYSVSWQGSCSLVALTVAGLALLLTDARLWPDIIFCVIVNGQSGASAGYLLYHHRTSWARPVGWATAAILSCAWLAGP